MLNITTKSESPNALRVAQFLNGKAVTVMDFRQAVFVAMNTPEAKAAMNAAVRAGKAGETVDVVVDDKDSVVTAVVVGMLMGTGAEVSGMEADPTLPRYYAQFKMFQMDANVECVDVAPETVCGDGSVERALLTVADYLTVENVKDALKWVHDGLAAKKTRNDKRSSHDLNRMLEDETGIYLTDNQFKHAMAVCGFAVAKEDGPDAYYRVAEKSPAIVRAKERETA